MRSIVCNTSYILDISPLWEVSFANIFSLSIGCLFVLLVSFSMQKLFSLMWSHSFIFFFVFTSLAFGVKFTKKFSEIKVPTLRPVFFSYVFYCFRSYIQVILIQFLCVVSGSSLVSLVCMWFSSFPNIIYWRGFPLSIVCLWLLCRKLVAHIVVGLFLAHREPFIGNSSCHLVIRKNGMLDDYFITKIIIVDWLLLHLTGNIRRL